MSKVYIIKEIESISLTLPLITWACEGRRGAGGAAAGLCVSPASVITHKGEDTREGQCVGDQISCLVIKRSVKGIENCVGG